MTDTHSLPLWSLRTRPKFYACPSSQNDYSWHPMYVSPVTMTADFSMRLLERNASPLPNNTGDSILCKEDIWQGSLQPGKQKHFNSIWKSGIKNIMYDKFRGLPSKTDVCIRSEWRLRTPRRLPLTGSRLCQTLRPWVFKVEIILQSVCRHSLYPKLQPTHWKLTRANTAIRHKRNLIFHF